MQVADILINLGLPPIEDIPHLPKIVWDALTAVTLILECLQGALDSGAGPWDYTPFPPFFSLALEATVGENMVIYIYVYNGGGRDLALLHSCDPATPTTTSRDLGAQVGHVAPTRWGHPPITVMTAFSSGIGVESLPSGPSSGSVPQVSDPVILKLRIMPQSLSLCLTG
jgi:hypothetical protein